MKMKIAENIKYFRKEMGLVQEQLAEAMGVTVSAVSKWEQGMSVPEIEMLVELADFFGTTVDMILGYEFHSNSIAMTLQELKRLSFSNEFEKLKTELEKAVKRYPNCFEIIYESARDSAMVGSKLGDEESIRYAIQLFRHALELAEAGKDTGEKKKEIVEWMIEMFLELGKPEEAEEVLKTLARNPRDIIVAKVSERCERYDDALQCLSGMLMNFMYDFDEMVSIYMKCYGNKGEWNFALEMGKWAHSIYEGLKNETEITYLNRRDLIILTACACVAAELGDVWMTEKYLRMAKQEAEQFDLTPGYGREKMKFYHGDIKTHSYDDFGNTSIEGIENTIAQREGKARELLLKIWEDLNHETAEQ